MNDELKLEDAAEVLGAMPHFASMRDSNFPHWVEWLQYRQDAVVEVCAKTVLEVCAKVAGGICGPIHLGDRLRALKHKQPDVEREKTIEGVFEVLDKAKAVAITQHADYPLAARLRDVMHELKKPIPERAGDSA